MIQELIQLKLYSLSEAAAAMSIGRDTLRKIIRDGKIGCILIGSSKRIPYQELVRYQSENVIRRSEPVDSPNIGEQQNFTLRRRSANQNSNSKQILKEIIRSNTNGNCKKAR